MYKLLLLSLLALTPLAADAAITGSSSEAFSPEKGLNLSHSFQVQREAIITALGDGKTYSEIPPQDQQMVRESLDRISAWLGDAQTVEQVAHDVRVRAFNEQEKINTLLTRAHADSRLVCKREKLIGSNRPTNTCSTVAERRRAREGAVNYLNTLPKAQGSLETR